MDGRLGRVTVVSPHCDDGVFGCGELLAGHPGSAVITVFAGTPPSYDGVTPWDAAAGFGPGDDVVAARRREDAEALRVLGAAPKWLPFCDSQYLRACSVDAIADALEPLMLELAARAIFIPLGLFHSDHDLAHRAGMLVRQRQPALDWFAYEDAIYRRISGLVENRLRSLDGARPFPSERAPRAAALKRRAVECYASQIKALASYPGYGDIFEPERYWRLAA